jgi:serine/threonine-protein kinase
MQNLIGATIGKYVIESYLARGGMSEIYLAHDTTTEKTVAVKLVHTSQRENCLRFKREVRAIARLHHPHILPILDNGEYASWCYMVTPYISNGTLHERLARGPLTLEETGRLLRQLADALSYAHTQGIVHRDIKPSNILLDEEGFIYLADFGLVKGIPDDHSVTQSEYIVGTPEYLAPELVDGQATALSDIYALGILLYQMLCGRVPFKGHTPVATVWQHLYDEPEPPSRRNPTIPPAVEYVILHAITKQPVKRIQSVEQLALAYQEALLNPTIETEELVLEPAKICVQPISEFTTLKRSTKQSRLALSALVALLVATLYIGPALLLSLIEGNPAEHAYMLDTHIAVKHSQELTPAIEITIPIGKGVTSVVQPNNTPSVNTNDKNDEKNQSDDENSENSGKKGKKKG